MKLDAVKFGLAAAIVAAVLWLVTRLMFLAALPAGPTWRGGYMMNGGGGHMGWAGHPHLFAFGWIGVVAGLVLWPLLAGIAAWGTAAIYNWLLGRAVADESTPTSAD